MADPEDVLSSVGSGAGERFPEAPSVRRPRDPGFAAVERLIEQQAQRHPDRVAVRGPSRTLTYGDLERRAEWLALRLLRLGAGAESRVGLLLERAPEWVVAQLAVLKAGAAWVPMDPADPASRLASVAAEAQLDLLLTSGKLATRCRPLAPTVIDLKHEPPAPSDAVVGPLPGAPPEGLAYVMFTSGSSGSPKGVAVSRRSLAWYARTAVRNYDLDAAARVLQLASTASDISVDEIFPCLSSGGALCLRGAASPPSPAEILQLCAELSITHIMPPTALWHELARYLARHPDALPRSLRLVSIGGERASSRRIEDWKAAVGPRVRLMNGYGPTETTVLATLHEYSPDSRVREPGSWIGRPLHGVGARVVDAELRPVAEGDAGELCITGQGVARGYLARPCLTAERFVPDPFAARPGGRSYRSGDRVRRRPDGGLEYLGRLDRQVKVGGFRVEPGEIEAQLLRQRSVREAAVVPEPDAEGRMRLAAYVVAEADAVPAELRRSWERDQVERHRRIYEETYATVDPGDAVSRLAGWNDSVQGEPIPGHEMREWAAGTVDRLQSLEPRRVLEIGCGTGLLMFPLAPLCEVYVGTDFSQRIVDLVQLRIESISGLGDTARVICAEAADCRAIEREAFDLVVLNSVTQYLPSVEYVVRVLSGALQSLAPGGSIFVGDVRNLALLEAFWTWVHVEREGERLSLEELRRRVEASRHEEPELVLDPGFFRELAARLPGIQRVRVLPKTARAPNELTRFRYDVVLESGGADEDSAAATLDWKNERLSIARLESLLSERRPARLRLEAVSNPHLAREMALLSAMRHVGGAVTVAEVSGDRAAPAPAAADPGRLERRCAALGYGCEPSWAAGRADGSYDALLWRLEESSGRERPRLQTRRDAVGRSLQRYATDPLRQRLAAWLVPQLRERLSGVLPRAMVPSRFVLLERLPMTRSGKVDLGRLPPTGRSRPLLRNAFVATGTPTECRLAAIWRDLLDLDRVGVDDDFFELGGHSLLATRLVTRVRDELGAELALRTLFERPTLAELAAALDSACEVQSTRPPQRQVTRPRPSVLPLSFAQRRLWFVQRLEPSSAAYNVSEVFRLRGVLRASLLERALGQVVQRHESLRTCFVDVGSGPRQLIADECELRLRRVVVAAGQSAERLLQAESVQPFDLERAPLLRASLLELGPDEHLLQLTIHHIVTDGWSQGILCREISACYEALCSGGIAALPDLPIQYADFALQQRERLTGEVRVEHLRYWREHLRDLPPLVLPTARRREPDLTERGHECRLELSARLGASIRALGVELHASPFMTLLAGFLVLLHRYSGQRLVAVGSPVANRDHAEFEGLIGLLLDMVVLKGDFSGDPSFRELLAQVRETVLGARDYQQMPFEELVQELQPARESNRRPLFQVLFNMMNLPEGELELAGLEVTRLPEPQITARFDLTLYVWEVGERLLLQLIYRDGLFDRPQITRLLGHLEEILQQATAAPEAPVSTLRLAVPGVRVTEEASELASNLTPSEELRRRARRTPDRLAVETASERWTFAALDRAADQVARGLLEARLQGNRVALLLGRDGPLVPPLLGALRAGAAYVPLDPDAPVARLERILEDSQSTALIADRDSASLAARLCGEGRTTLELERLLADARPLAPLPSVDPDCEAYLLYTSGSSGRPKGVVQSQRNLHFHASSYVRELGLRSSDRISLLASYTFDAAVLDVYGALLAGATLVPLDPRRLRPEALARRLEEQAITVYHSTPSLWRSLAERPVGGPKWPRLRRIVLGGEEMLASDLVPCRGLGAAGCRVVNLYGSTEATFAVRQNVDRDLPSRRTRVPIGTPIDGMEAVLRNAAGQQAAIYGEGEMFLRSRHVALRYAGDPQGSERAFGRDHADGGERWYRTGDRARLLPDGSFEFVGRCDRQLKLRGHRVEPGEVEAVLVRHPEVLESAVVADSDGSGAPRLAAYCVGRGGGPLDVASLRAHLAEELPAYMAPSTLTVVRALPRTPSGKLDRRALPKPAASATGLKGDAPRGPIEEVVGEIWTDLLGVGRLGIDDDFFDLGGHSLLATRVVSRVRAVLGVELPLRALFDHPTVSGLAAAIGTISNRGAGEAQPPLVRRDGPDAPPLSFGQERLWFLDLLDPGSGAYRVTSVHRLEGELDVEALEESLADVVRRHETLRTTFASVSGRPHQVVAAPAERYPLELEDLSGLSPGERERALGRQLEGLEESAFDLERGPLLHPLLVRLGPGEHVLVLSLHHIVTDGWSQGILFRELERGYRTRRNGGAPSLPELPIQYADFAVWQRQWLTGEALERQLAYWRRQLADLPALELPTDRPRPQGPAARAAAFDFTLSEELSAALRALCRERGTTLYMALLAALFVLLERHTGQDDLAVGSPIANRGREEIEGLIGFFVNLLVLRGDLAGDPTFDQLLARVRETALAAYAHQDLPFEKLVEELRPERDTRRHPFFQVTLALQNAPSGALDLPGLEVSRIETLGRRAHCDLELFFWETPGPLEARLVYNPDLFDHTRIGRFVRQLENLLGDIVADPRRPISELEVLPRAQRHQLLLEWNDTEAAPSEVVGVHQLFERQVDRTPDAVALVFNDETLSYRQLDRRANRLAHHLIELGVGPEIPVALLLERSFEMVVALLAVLKAGGAYLPLDPDTPRERLRQLLRQTGANWLLSDGHRGRELAAVAPRRLELERAEQLATSHSDASPSVAVSPHGLAYLIHTSGSTGRPKGVLGVHGAATAYVEDLVSRASLSPADVCLQLAPLALDISIRELMAPLSTGGRLVIADRETARDPEAVWHAITRYGVTCLLGLGPSRLRQLVEVPVAAGGSAACVRLVLLAGEPLPAALARRARERFGDSTEIVNLYGLTETTCTATHHRVVDADRGTVPAGQPDAGTSVYVLDDRGCPVPPGACGEVHLGGPGSSRGYLREQGLTAEVFLPDPFGSQPGARLFRTGDLARQRADGAIELLGRHDDQVKIRGFRVEPAEVQVVLESLPGVARAVVVARDVDDGGKSLVGYIERDGARGELVSAARELCRRTLPPFLCPSRFVVLDRLPCTLGGKVDRAALPAPGAGRPSLEREAVSPRTTAERRLMEIWCELLGTDEIGIDDDFFDLGGHSLLATQLVSRIRSAFGVAVPLRAVFDDPTIARIAARLAKVRDAPSDIPAIAEGIERGRL